MYRARPADGLAWITGASSGIGRAAALELVRRGYRVAVTARRAEALAALAREAPDAIFAFPGDVTDCVEMAGLAADIEKNHGVIALAFLNAGANFRDPPDDPCGVNFRKTLDINLNGVVNCLGPLVKAMSARRRGQIAINASLAGYGGLPGAAAYSASKSALIVMCQSLHIDLGAQGIAVQVVSPGYVRTPMTDRNDYAMPFMLELDDAVQRICNGFERGGFEIAFPRRMAYFLKALNMLPAPLYLTLMRRFGMRRANKTSPEQV